MEKQYWCKCGFGPKSKKEIARHVYFNAASEKGKHGRVDEKPAVTPIKPDKSLEPKKTGGRRWWLIWVGVVLLAIAIPVFFFYMQNPENTFMAFVLILFGGGGATCLWYGLKKREESVYFKTPDAEGKQFKGRANCMNIYYRLDRGKLCTDRIEFEQLSQEELIAMKNEGRLGKYQRCRNDGNYYYVHELVPEQDGSGKYKPVKDWKFYPFLLPDEVYFSPCELANVVTMPATQKLYKPKPGKFDKLKPWLLLAGAGILFLLIIVLQPTPATGG